MFGNIIQKSFERKLRMQNRKLHMQNRQLAPAIAKSYNPLSNITVEMVGSIPKLPTCFLKNPIVPFDKSTNNNICYPFHNTYFIIFLHYHFVHHDNEILLDLINIDKKSLIVITNNYDTKKT